MRAIKIHVDKIRVVGGLFNVNEVSTEGIGSSSNVNVEIKFLSSRNEYDVVKDFTADI